MTVEDAALSPVSPTAAEATCLESREVATCPQSPFPRSPGSWSDSEDEADRRGLAKPPVAGPRTPPLPARVKTVRWGARPEADVEVEDRLPPVVPRERPAPAEGLHYPREEDSATGPADDAQDEEWWPKPALRFVYQR